MRPRTPIDISLRFMLEKEKKGVPIACEARHVPGDEGRRLGERFGGSRSDLSRFARHRLFASVRFLEGFAMDVDGRTYRGLDDTIRCWYYVAGVVGVMMTYVMGVRDEPTRLLRDSPAVFSVCPGRRDGHGDLSGHRAGCFAAGRGRLGRESHYRPFRASFISSRKEASRRWRP